MTGLGQVAAFFIYPKEWGSFKVNAVGKSFEDGHSYNFLFLPNCFRSRQIFVPIFTPNKVWLLEHPKKYFDEPRSCTCSCGELGSVNHAGACLAKHVTMTKPSYLPTLMANT